MPECLRLRHCENFSGCIVLLFVKTWNGLRRRGTTVESRNSLINSSIEFASSSTYLRSKQGVNCPSTLSHFVSATACSSGRGPARAETTRQMRSLDMFTILDETVLEWGVCETSGYPLRKSWYRREDWQQSAYCPRERCLHAIATSYLCVRSSTPLSLSSCTLIT